MDDEERVAQLVDGGISRDDVARLLGLSRKRVGELYRTATERRRKDRLKKFGRVGPAEFRMMTEDW